MNNNYKVKDNHAIIHRPREVMEEGWIVKGDEGERKQRVWKVGEAVIEMQN